MTPTPPPANSEAKVEEAMKMAAKERLCKFLTPKEKALITLADEVIRLRAKVEEWKDLYEANHG